MTVETRWGQEDQEGGWVSEPSEETCKPVKMNEPYAPSQKDKEQHEMSHLPFRSALGLHVPQAEGLSR